MIKILLALSSTLLLISCVVIPVLDNIHHNKCEISSNRKVLKVVDVAKETNSYYSIGGIILSPILIPTSAILSGSYVAINNVYNLSEEKFVCKSDIATTDMTMLAGS